MGWDTQINIIVEDIVSEEIEIARCLFETDANSYYQNGLAFIKVRECENGLRTLFFTYQRRKYLPYWTIQEVSKTFRDKYFTVIGSSPEFMCGTAGIVKIVGGEIIDSYGFAERFGDIADTTRVLENPDPEVLFQCFGKNKLEESIRESYVESNTPKWVDENYCDNLLDFKVEEIAIFENIIKTFKDEHSRWSEIQLPTTSSV